LGNSIKSNVAYNSLLRLMNIIFPLITFPYVARILLPVGLGKVDFSVSIIQYFIILSQLGIPIYAVRECAKVRDNKDKLEKTVQEILAINLVAVVVSYVTFAILITNLSIFDGYRALLLVLSINIVSTFIGVEWFYQSIEKYKYITVRSAIVKLVAVISIFIFVRDEKDFIIYGIITALSVSLGNLYNFFYLRKHITILHRIGNYNFRRHVKPILWLFAMSLSVSIYINLDLVMLGFISGDTSVGYYTAANKIIKVVLALITSVGAVLLPRMSYYVENNDGARIDDLINKSLNFILMISIPASVGIVLLAKPIILIFAGVQYEESVIVMKLLGPIIVAIALSNLIGIQILVSHGKERLTLYSTIVGAVVNFSLNIILIPMYSHIGAAIGTLIAEFSVTMVQVIFAYEHIRGCVSIKNVLSYLLGGGVIIVTIRIIEDISSNMVSFTLLSIFFSIIMYFEFLYLIKNNLVVDTVGATKDAIRKKRSR